MYPYVQKEEGREGGRKGGREGGKGGSREYQKVSKEPEVYSLWRRVTRQLI